MKNESQEHKVARKGMGTKWRSRSADFWSSRVAAIDNKTYPIYTTHEGRTHSHMQRKRGSYRTDEDGLEDEHIAPDSKKHRYSSQGKQAKVTAGFGGGRCLFWKVYTGNWCADKYVDVVRQHLSKVMRDDFPNGFLLRDNDPTGYESGKGLQAEATAGFGNRRIELGPKSPDVNPLDFFFWDEITKRMHAVEKTWPPDKVETEAGFRKRLRDTAFSLEPAIINKAMESMRKRCKLLVDAKGGHIKCD